MYSGPMVLSEQVTHCMLCGSQKKNLFYRGYHFEMLMQYWLCKNCGLVYQSPYMSEVLLEQFYAQHYRVIYHGQADPTAHDLRIQRKRALHLVNVICQKANLSIQQHIDIGSSSGALLEAMQEASNCQSVGIEPGVAYREHASSNNMIVYSSLQEWEVSNRENPDIVTMSHVLEHIVDPVSYLIFLRENILKPNGYLLLEVPNLFFHKSFELAHNYAFSVGVLKELVKKAGFDVVFLKKHGYPIQKAPLYITLLAQVKPDLIQPTGMKSHIFGAKAYRKIGRFVVKAERFAGRLDRGLKRRTANFF